MIDKPGQPSDADQPRPPAPGDQAGHIPAADDDEKGSLWANAPAAAEPASPRQPEGVLFNQMLNQAAASPAPEDSEPALPIAHDDAEEPQPEPEATPAPVAVPLPAVVTSPAPANAVSPETSTPPARPANLKPIVRLVNVSKSFGSLHVLRSVSLDIYPGQTTVIIGPSGTGKSVLLKHITGLLKPDSGEVWFHDQRVDQLSEKKMVEVRKRMGFLFQMGALFDSMTVGENVAFPLTEHNKKISAVDRLDRVQTMLNIVGLKGVDRKMPGDLSGGQKKRVALARAIVLEPELVLYDEPTTGLDPIRSDVINELILGLTRQLGIASIVVTHDMASADKIADRMVMLYDGKIVIDDTPEAFHQNENDLVRRFIKGQADQDELDAIRDGIAPVARHAMD